MQSLLAILFTVFIYTINGETFAMLNICGFSPIEFLQKYFRDALASGVYYLAIAKYSWENFCGTLKNCKNRESLAQQIFPRLQYQFHTEMGDYFIRV